MAATGDALLAACSCREWAEEVAGVYRGLDHLLAVGEQVWWALPPAVWREALAAHPAIGAPTAAGSQERVEQSATADADEALLTELRAGNAAYADRFGMTYVVRAAGRSVQEMLTLLTERLGNDPETELRVAAGQQWEITALRLTTRYGKG